MKDIFITATNTDVGKTYTTLQLLKTLAQRGLQVGVFKPIETGVNNYPMDAALLLESIQKVNSAFDQFKLEDICPLQFPLAAAPFVAAGGKTLNLDLVFKKYTLLKKNCDILLIEGAGGLLVPIHENYFMYNLIHSFDATTLLVTHDKLGCINDTLLNLSFAETQNIDMTWCINIRDPENFAKVTLPFYKAYFDKMLTLQNDLDKLTQKLIKKIDQ